jgi:hypothetical protein
MDADSINRVLDSADKLSDMANKVAGFAISSNLLLTFACLKDLGSWVKRQTVAFLIGVAVGGCVYVAAIWILYAQEFAIRNVVASADFASILCQTGDVLVWSRTLGVVAFTLVAALAVWGTSKE